MKTPIQKAHLSVCVFLPLVIQVFTDRLLSADTACESAELVTTNKDSSWEGDSALGRKGLAYLNNSNFQICYRARSHTYQECATSPECKQFAITIILANQNQAAEDHLVKFLHVCASVCLNYI